MSVSVPNSLWMFYWHLEGHTVLRNKCKFNKKQQNVTTILFVVKQSYQCIRKIKAEESGNEEGVFLPSFFLQHFLSSSHSFHFFLYFPVKDGWSVPVTLKFFIPCYMYMQKIIKSADRNRVQTKFFCIDIIMEVISNVMDVPWEQSTSRMSKTQTLYEYLWKKNLCALKMSRIIRTVCLFSVTSAFT